MATKVRTNRTQLRTGPFTGVRATLDPYDDATSQNLLVDAVNCYIPDPISGSGIYARPGFALANPSSPLAGRGQCVYAHTSLTDSLTYNFIVAGGVLYRADAALATFTNVTPVGITIDPTVTHVYCTSFADFLIVSDGVNRPWIGSNFSGSPITGAYIDYDGAGTAWNAYGRPTIYKGSVFFILNTVNSVGRRTDITWSLAGDPTRGYQQTNYDFNWTLEQTGSSPLYAIWGTNVSLFYWRDASVGAVNGTPGPSLSSTATADALDDNIGTLQSATIAQYGNSIYFCDQIGRPWRMQIGLSPEPIWLNLRSVAENSTIAYPSATAQVAGAVIDPSSNLYTAAIWSPTAAIANAPVEAQIFDAKTAAYLGRWIVSTGISIEAIGVLNNTTGRASLVIVGSKIVAGASGYIWALSGGGDESGIFWFVTEDALDYLTTEDDQIFTTENETISWLDNGAVPTISATTQRFGYADETVWNVDRATIIAGSAAPCTVTIQTPTTAGTLEGTPAPSPSFDGTYRLVCGADVQGRGVQVTVSPTTATSQWSLQSVAIDAVPSVAGPDDA